MRGRGALEQGKTVLCSWHMYGVTAEVKVRWLEPNRKILLDWPTPVESTFDPRGDGTTLQTITASGFAGIDCHFADLDAIDGKDSGAGLPGPLLQKPYP